MAVMCLISVVSAWLVKETYKADLANVPERAKMA
jgi:hypothetical protein